MKRIFGAAAFAAIAGASSAQVFYSGFESATTISSFTTVSSVATNALGGAWTVEAGTVDWIGGYWQAGGGSKSLDLSGNNLGRISTTFKTLKDRRYGVSFLMAGNPDGPPANKGVRVTVTPANPAAVSLQFTFLVVPGVNTRTNMGWQERSFEFVGLTADTKLTFESLSVGPNGQVAFGAALDEVRVNDLGVAAEPVPEPFTLALGAAGLAAAVRRRRARRG